MAHCRNCGMEIDDNARICLNCGTPRMQEQTPRSTGGSPYLYDHSQAQRYSQGALNPQEQPQQYYGEQAQPRQYYGGQQAQPGQYYGGQQDSRYAQDQVPESVRLAAQQYSRAAGSSLCAGSGAGVCPTGSTAILPGTGSPLCAGPGAAVCPAGTAEFSGTAAAVCRKKRADSELLRYLSRTWISGSCRNLFPEISDIQREGPQKRILVFQTILLAGCYCTAYSCSCFSRHCYERDFRPSSACVRPDHTPSRSGGLVAQNARYRKVRNVESDPVCSVHRMDFVADLPDHGQ